MNEHRTNTTQGPSGSFLWFTGFLLAGIAIGILAERYWSTFPWKEKESPAAQADPQDTFDPNAEVDDILLLELQLRGQVQQLSSSLMKAHDDKRGAQIHRELLLGGGYSETDEVVLAVNDQIAASNEAIEMLEKDQAEAVALRDQLQDMRHALAMKELPRGVDDEIIRSARRVLIKEELRKSASTEHGLRGHEKD